MNISKKERHNFPIKPQVNQVFLQENQTTNKIESFNLPRETQCKLDKIKKLDEIGQNCKLDEIEQIKKLDNIEKWTKLKIGQN